MVEQEGKPDRLSDILKAASDPSRRRILTLLVQEGPMRVTDLARFFAMSLNAVSKHIKVLEAAGLVRRETRWREHVISADLGSLSQIDQWFRELCLLWDARLEALDDLLTREKTDDHDHD